MRSAARVEYAAPQHIQLFELIIDPIAASAYGPVRQRAVQRPGKTSHN
jgi:hypothetical protein